MNRVIRLLTLGLVAAIAIFYFAAIDASPAAAEDSPSQSETLTVTVEVQEMVCRSCVRRIESALEDTIGVVDMSVDLPKRRADVEYMPSVIDARAIVGVIDELGYTVEKLDVD